jgi:5'-nucleotidase
MKFLLTNDDGIAAPGLAALDRAVHALGESVVVAPADHCSGCSHSVTTHRPLVLTRQDARRHALDGNPVDCTRLGLWHVAPEVEWVISGINAGGNLGADVYISGTVAAAREAALMGRQAIAVSQYRGRDREIDWETASDWTREILTLLVDRPLPPGRFWNVNLPHLAPGASQPEIVFCRLDPHPLPVEYHQDEEGRFHYAGVYHSRSRHPERDVEICFSGRIAACELGLE